ncbi:putative metallophosphoesterase YunD [Cohnella xylanilytica]|uniref:bifunctional metallophosphatase/5'-nucleotidase n=1 Tax=Cohnella xylanilytica TaxID=557555 RepID=UPI001B138567|nr:bifunctional UDP-sugar hydrolase/5'-nucleotidase [Cohnella xylanilytica]GIO14554.1 putative metallophosphoesterase YunD [Cohnella xylanilytica]
MNASSETLILLHTNDIHSHLEEAARIAGYVEELRKTVPRERMLLFDIGDFLDRARVETEGTEGMANRRLLDAIGYDAVTMGNNEGLSYTGPELDALFADAPFPVVCANLVRSDTGSRPDWMKPAVVLERAGFLLGLVGLTVPYEEFYGLLGWKAEDPIRAAEEWVAKLRGEADVVIVLSHLGLRQDERLAQTVGGIDLILGAHTHHLLETPLRVGDTLLCAAGKFGRHLGVLEISKKPAGGGLSVEGGSLSTEGMAPAEGIERLLKSSLEEAVSRMDVAIATLKKPLPSHPDRESPLGTLLAAAIRRTTGAEIGLANAGQLLGGLPAGRVTRGDVHAICPSPINPCLMMLKGSQLRRALEESLLPEFIGLEFQGFGFRGRVLGTLCADGLEWTVDEAKPPYERVVGATAGGRPLEDDREYAVGTLDMFTFGVGYKGLKEGTVVRYQLPEFIRDVLAEALNDESAVADCERPRRRSAEGTDR